MARYVIGIDYGTLSCRSILVDTSNGKLVASSTHEYLHGILSSSLPDGTPMLAYYDAAGALGVSIHTYLSMLAEKKRPGETGLLALDWINGNRSTLCDYDLSALVLGMSMQTKCEDIYRALLESTAFGCQTIVENYINNGVPVERFTASGGISLKNTLAMQIYSDVLNMRIEVIDAEVGAALGSAVFAAVAAGCYEDIQAAAYAMKSKSLAVYTPKPENVRIYEALYREYLSLYEYFGKTCGTMHRLRAIRNSAAVSEA